MLTDLRSFFVQRPVYLQPMLRCVVLIPQIKFIDMKMMVECLIVTKGQLMIELWVLELGVVDGRANKDAAKTRLLPKFPFFSKYHNFWSIGRCANVFWDFVDNSHISTLEFLLMNLTHIIRPTALYQVSFNC